MLQKEKSSKGRVDEKTLYTNTNCEHCHFNMHGKRFVAPALLCHLLRIPASKKHHDW